MTPDPTLIEQVARKLAMFLFETWGDAEGVVWANLADKERATAFKAAEAAIATLQGSAALPSEAMIEAAWHAHREIIGLPPSPFLPGRGDCRALYVAIYTAMRATTPTAPLQDTSVPCGTGSRASHEASISVESSPKASIPNAVTISGELYAFLMGQGPLEGVWFGDLNAGLRGRFWWRALLRCAAGWPASAIETEGGDVKQAPSRSDESAAPQEDAHD